MIWLGGERTIRLKETELNPFGPEDFVWVRTLVDGYFASLILQFYPLIFDSRFLLLRTCQIRDASSCYTSQASTEQ